MEATSELFFAETFKLQFFPKYTTLYNAGVLPFLTCFLHTVHYAKDFQVGKTQNLSKKCQIKLAWTSENKWDDSGWAMLLYMTTCAVDHAGENQWLFPQTETHKWPIQYCCILTSLRDTHLKAIDSHVYSPMMSVHSQDINIQS